MLGDEVDEDMKWVGHGGKEKVLLKGLLEEIESVSRWRGSDETSSDGFTGQEYL